MSLTLDIQNCRATLLNALPSHEQMRTRAHTRQQVHERECSNTCTFKTKTYDLLGTSCLHPSKKDKHSCGRHELYTFAMLHVHADVCHSYSRTVPSAGAVHHGGARGRDVWLGVAVDGTKLCPLSYTAKRALPW